IMRLSCRLPVFLDRAIIACSLLRLHLPEGTAMARLSLSLLGAVQVRLDSAAVTTFDSDKVRALLVYLAVEAHQPHRREALVGLLWPESAEAAARRSLNQALYNLRHAIGDQTATPPYFHIRREALQFNTASDHALDVATFSALLDAW